MEVVRNASMHRSIQILFVVVVDAAAVDDDDDDDEASALTKDFLIQ